MQDELNALGIDPGRPLLISDADEVLFAFMEGFESFLNSRGLSFSWASFRLNGNIIEDRTGEAVEARAVRSLIYSFFENHTRTIAAVDGAAESLRHLGHHLQIVVLSNIWSEFRDARAHALRSQGMPYPVITNNGSKAPAVAHLASLTSGPAFFIDDSPEHHRDIADLAGDVIRIHYVSNRRLAGLLGPAANCHHHAHDWPGICSFIENCLGVGTS